MLSFTLQQEFNSFWMPVSYFVNIQVTSNEQQQNKCSLHLFLQLINIGYVLVGRKTENKKQNYF